MMMDLQQLSVLWLLLLTLVWLVEGSMQTASYQNSTLYSKSRTKWKAPPSDEKVLIKVLLKDYRKVGIIGRPVINTSHPVTVDFGLGLISMEIEEKSNMMLMSVWTRLHWMDEYMRWDPSDYGGVDSVKLPHTEIWTPDIMLYNTATTVEMERPALAVISHNGSVNWFPHRLFQSSCSINVRRFPFDNQTCHMMFGSWTHSTKELDVDLAFENGIDLSTFQSSYKDCNKWDITKVEAVKQVGEDQYSSVLIFSIYLKRKMIFSSYILTIPAVFLSLLTLVIFWLPADDAEKTALGLTIFSSMLLLLLILLEAAPPTASAVPLLGIYYCFTTVLVIMSVFLASIVVKISHGGSKKRRLPAIVKTVMIKGLGRILCVHVPTPTFATELQHNSNSNMNSCKVEQLQNNSVQRGYLKLSTFDQDPESVALQQHTMCKSSCFSELREQLRRMREVLETMANKQEHAKELQDNDRNSESEWKHLAGILDRLFLIVYMGAIVLSLIFLFPHGYISWHHED